MVQRFMVSLWACLRPCGLLTLWEEDRVHSKGFTIHKVYILVWKNEQFSTQTCGLYGVLKGYQCYGGKVKLGRGLKRMYSLCVF
jgi:hypothetical protein